MTRTVTTEVRVEWGDCDPAGIVYYPNFFHWCDVATWNFFAACGVPLDGLQARYGIVGLPLLAASAAFRAPARPRDAITVRTTLGAVKSKTFEIRHAFWRGTTSLLEAQETRIWAHGDAARPSGMRAGTLPPEVVRLLTAPEDAEPAA